MARGTDINQLKSSMTTKMRNMTNTMLMTTKDDKHDCKDNEYGEHDNDKHDGDDHDKDDHDDNDDNNDDDND
jgi:hypothetical protein